MVERLFRLKEKHLRQQINILLGKGLQLFFRLPHSDREYRAGPSWGEIAPKKARRLPTIDRRFLLRGHGEPSDKARICVGFNGPDCWIGIEVQGRRVRYLGKNPVLEVLHEEMEEGDSWRVIFSEKRESWDSFGRVVQIGEALLASIEN